MWISTIDVRFKTRQSGVVILCLSFLANTAEAELTAEQTWKELKHFAAIYGGHMSGESQRSGDTLAVSDITVDFDLGKAGVTRLSLGPLKLTELDDGSVRLIHPEEQTLTLSSDDQRGDGALTMQIARNGLTMIASGEPGDVTYSTTADGLSFAILETPFDTQNTADQPFAWSVRSRGLSAETRVQTRSGIVVSNQSTHQTLDIGIMAQDSEGTYIDLSSRARDAVTSYSTEYPETQVRWSGFTSALRDGLALSLSFQTGDYRIDLITTEPGEAPYKFDLELADYLSAYTLDRTGWGYRVDGHSIALKFAELDPTVPLMSAERAMLDIRFPILGAQDIQDLTFDADILNLTLSDVYRQMLDPDGLLPAGPLSGALSSVYGLRVPVGLFDSFDAGSTRETREPEMFLQTLGINDLRLNAWGAEVTGKASFTFDNGDMESFDGIPAPTGTADFSLTGVHEVIDQLLATGGITAGEAMQARAGLGMITVPAETPGVLKSKIEVDGATGHVTANGIRIK